MDSKPEALFPGRSRVGVLQPLEDSMDHENLLRLAKKHGTPLFIVDHKVLRENYGQFRKYLPRVQVYYAVKANSDPAIVKTFYDWGPASTSPAWPSS